MTEQDRLPLGSNPGESIRLATLDSFPRRLPPRSLTLARGNPGESTFDDLTWEPIPASWPGGLPGYIFLAAFAASVTYAIGEDVTSIVNDLRGAREGRMDVLTPLLSWPAERVPDGTVLAIHHYWTGLIIVLYPVWHVSDDHPHREPSVVLDGILTATLGFLTWQHHPVAGASLTHVGLLTIAGAMVIGDFMSRYRWRGFRGVVLLGLLVSLDNLLNHAWRVTTPLDGWLWMEVILPFLYQLRVLLT